MRTAFGLQSAVDFNNFAQPAFVNKLKTAYGSINLLDPWVGIIC